MPEEARHGNEPRWLRIARTAVLASVAAFVALMGAAMALYPGGTWMDRRAPGHDLARNFFCDISADVALNGDPNPGAKLAMAAMLALALGLGPFWLLVARRLAGAPRRSAAVRALGLASAAALLLVPLLPSGRWGALHAIAIFIAAVPGLFAALLAARALLASPEARRPHGYLAAAALAVAAIDSALYAELVASGAKVPSWPLPAGQKLAAALLLAWVVVTAASTGGRAQPKL